MKEMLIDFTDIDRMTGEVLGNTILDWLMLYGLF